MIERQILRFQIDRTTIDEAERIANERFSRNSRRRPASDLGSVQANVSADFWGILGEMVAERIIAPLFAEAQFAPKLSDKPCPGADIKIGNLRLDVKSIRPGSHYARVNDAKLGKNLCDGYVFVEFFSKHEAILYRPVATSRVKRWRLHDKPIPGRGAVAPFRVESIHNLTAITSLPELFESIQRAELKFSMGHFSTTDSGVAHPSTAM